MDEYINVGKFVRFDFWQIKSKEIKFFLAMLW